MAKPDVEPAAAETLEELIARVDALTDRMDDAEDLIKDAQDKLGDHQENLDALEVKHSDQESDLIALGAGLQEQATGFDILKKELEFKARSRRKARG